VGPAVRAIPQAKKKRRKKEEENKKAGAVGI
jgi:hypothetical protein